MSNVITVAVTLAVTVRRPKTRAGPDAAPLVFLNSFEPLSPPTGHSLFRWWNLVLTAFRTHI